MPQHANTQGFRGSDTDGLDKIVNKMQEAAEFADNMVLALRALCAALDAMSWTGYAAALAAYIRGTVIPLLQLVSRNLKLFASIVSLASNVQKDTSSNRLVIDAGDTGYVPVTSVKGDPGQVESATGPQDDTVAAHEVGGVPSATLDLDKLQTVAGDIATIFDKVSALAESVDGDGIDDGTLGEQISKLGEVVQAIESFADDADGDADAAAGADVSDAGVDDGGAPASETAVGTGPTHTGGQVPGTETPSYTTGQIWQAVTGALRELGVLSPDGTVDATAAGFDTAAVSGDVDTIQTSLDSLRGHLGLDGVIGASATGSADVGDSDANGFSAISSVPPMVAQDPSFGDGLDAGTSFDAGGSAADTSFGSGNQGTGGSFGTDQDLFGTGDTAADTASGGYDTGYQDGYSAGYDAGSTETDGGTSPGSGDQPTYAAQTPSASMGSGGSGAGDPGGAGAGTGAGVPSDGSGYTPEQQATGQDATTENEQVVYHSRTVGTVGDHGSVGDGTVQTRLVSTAADTTPGGSSAAVPLSGAAVAASALGGLYARRARSNPDDADGQEAGPEAFATDS